MLFRLSPGPGSRTVRWAVPTVAVAVALTVAACGGADEQQGYTAQAVEAFDCPYTDAAVSDAVGAEAQLLRSDEQVCAYGRPDDRGRASLEEPIVRVAAADEPVEELRAEAEARETSVVVDRSDLSPAAFMRIQRLRGQRQRVSLEFAHRGESWIVAVDMPRGPHATRDAFHAAQQLTDELRG